MARIVVIDNYDSFTYNLVQHLEVLGATCDVILNDACDVGAIAARAPHGIVISPGPCTPDEAVRLAARELFGEIPILGCPRLIDRSAFGGKVVRADRLSRKTSRLSSARASSRALEPVHCARYIPSVERASLPADSR